MQSELEILTLERLSQRDRDKETRTQRNKETKRERQFLLDRDHKPFFTGIKPENNAFSFLCSSVRTKILKHTHTHTLVWQLAHIHTERTEQNWSISDLCLHLCCTLLCLALVYCTEKDQMALSGIVCLISNRSSVLKEYIPATTRVELENAQWGREKVRQWST